MKTQDLERLREAVADLTVWTRSASAVRAHRVNVLTAAEQAFAELQTALIDVRLAGERHWSVLPLRVGDGARLGLIARSELLPAVTTHEAEVLEQLTTSVVTALGEVKAMLGVRRLFSGSAAKEAAARAARYLVEFHSWGRSSNLSALLSRIDDRGRTPGVVDPASALDPSVGLSKRLGQYGASHLLDASSIAGLAHSVDLIDRTLVLEGANRRRALEAGASVRLAEAARVVAEMSVERLKDATRDRIRTGPLVAFGFRTVHDVLMRRAQLGMIPGIGATTANRISGAAQAIWQAAYEEAPVRIDVDRPTAEMHQLVQSLAVWDATRKTKNATDDVALAEALAPLARSVGHDCSTLIVMEGRGDRASFLESVAAVVNRASLISRTTTGLGPADAWADFLARPADYFAMLNELGFLSENEDAVAGGLPHEIADAIRAFELDTRHLTVSLRGYQTFGARFALVQRKVIVGDEMGLGKTVEALATFAHLHAKGARHGIVVCPAAVVTNWMREIESKSTLSAHRLHGAGRDAAFQSWVRDGGIAVTTYESLGWLGVRRPDSHRSAVRSSMRRTTSRIRPRSVRAGAR
ncbi:SNF2-related protein [Agromyces intestinalis]|uniref:SNF2-related protein n=1 Tax=Agromyces intestinalis TaxID=2592652 RepID=UPI001AEFDFA4|nr:SNF2-related protein [Agromyces intestinalis]